MDKRVMQSFTEYVEFLKWLNQMNERVGLPQVDYTETITQAWEQALYYGIEGDVA